MASQQPVSSRSSSMMSGPSSPFPLRQLFVLAFCRICEPIVFTSIFPYIYHMIRDLNIADDPGTISIYAGMVTSAFTLSEFLSSSLWGRLSDRFGRKPIIMVGLAGTGLSAFVLGFAPNLFVMILARVLGGLLNGNIGVLVTAVSDIAHVKQHQPRAFTFMPMSWCLGSIIGPLLGSALARPTEYYPNIFPPGSIFDVYPYLLPNLASAAIAFIGVVTCLFFFQEPHMQLKHRRDRYYELGDKVVQGAKKTCTYVASHTCLRSSAYSLVQTEDHEREPLLHTATATTNATTITTTTASASSQGDTRSYDTVGSPSPSTTSTLLDDEERRLEDTVVPPKEDLELPPKTFTRAVTVQIVCFGVMAFHVILFEQLFPIYMSTPEDKEAPVHLPFHFTGGLGLDLHTVGMVLSVQGLVTFGSMLFVFPAVCERVGPTKIARIVNTYAPLMHFLTPYSVIVPKPFQLPYVYMLIIIKCFVSTFAMTTNSILLARAAPSPLVLGTINGIGAAAASGARTASPLIMGNVHKLGLRLGYSGLVWWVTALIASIAAFLSRDVERQFEKIEEEGRKKEERMMAEAAEEIERFDSAASTTLPSIQEEDRESTLSSTTPTMAASRNGSCREQ